MALCRRFALRDPNVVLEWCAAALPIRTGREARSASYGNDASFLQFDQARRQVMPFAEARGYLIDEDVFRAVP